MLTSFGKNRAGTGIMLQLLTCDIHVIADDCRLDDFYLPSPQAVDIVYRQSASPVYLYM